MRRLRASLRLQRKRFVTREGKKERGRGRKRGRGKEREREIKID